MNRYLKIFICFLGLAFVMVANGSEYDEYEVTTIEASEATVLHVNLVRAGSVSFTSPESKVVSSGIDGSSDQLTIRYGKIPGVGVIVKFSTSKHANVVTSDNQHFTVESNTPTEILLQNLIYPNIIFQF